LSSIHSFVELQSYKEASSSSNWQIPMQDELDMLHKIGNWIFFHSLLTKNAICYKRQYKIKTNLMSL